MKNFFKGLLVGIGNITPGLSGSAFLIIFNLYEKCLEAISNIFHNFKKSFLFLFPIGLGVLIGTYLFSNIIFYFINKYSMGTSIVFIGFLLGTIPSLFNTACKYGFKNSYMISFFITFSLGIFLLFLKNSFYFNFNTNFFSLILLGFILCIATVVPGISSTVLLNIFNMYQTYLIAINNIDISLLFPILVGFIICFFLISKLITFLLKKFYGYTFFAILGFLISTMASLLKFNIILNFEFFISLILSIIAFYVTNYSLLLSKRN